MIGSSKTLLQASAGAGGGLTPTSYLAVGSRVTSPSFSSVVTLLDFSDPANLTVSDQHFFTNSGYNEPFSFDFTRKGDWLLVVAPSSSGSGNYAIHLFSNPVSTGTLTHVSEFIPTGAFSSVQQARFSPDGNYVFAIDFSGTAVAVLDHTTPGTLSLSGTYTGISTFGAFTVSNSGDYVAYGDYGGVVTLLDHTTPGSLSFADSYTIGSGYLIYHPSQLEFTNDDKYLYVGNRDNYPTLHLFDHTTSGTLTLSDTYAFETSNFGYVTALSMSPAGQHIAGIGKSAYRTFIFDVDSTPGSFSTPYTNSSASGDNGDGQFTGDGSYFITRYSNNLNIFDHTTPGTFSLVRSYTDADFGSYSYTVFNSGYTYDIGVSYN